MNPAIDQDVVKLYKSGNYSTYELAEKFETYPNKIRRILRKNGVPLRSKSAAQKNALKKGRAKAAADIANAVYENAMKGNITAQIWYEKTRRGLSDKVQIDGDVEIKLNYEWKPKEQRPEAGDLGTLDESNP